PKWMKDGYTLLDVCRAGAENWRAVVNSWTELEEAYGFLTSTAALPSKPGSRPVEVGQWIKYGRSTTRPMLIGNHEELVSKWWGWWSSLALEWREKDESGRPRVGGEIGEWGTLAHPGGNRVLTVLLPLVWWREGKKSEVASEDWLAAVHDVLWVLQGLLSAVKGYMPIHNTRDDS
ncbi:hypothetical protein K438DRAFT_1629980, partial [Mycena galopus ATCC 62051]